jgi:hypothetical protein
MKEAIKKANNGHKGYLRFEAGDKKSKVKFIPEKMRPIVSPFTKPNGTVEHVPRYEFTVQDLDSNNPTEEMTLTTSMTVAKDILKWIERK